MNVVLMNAGREERDRDAVFMRRAIALAARGEGAVEPNPLVGCVVVRDGRIVGEGWHARFGGPHAEVAALESAGAAARGATLYVSLEPCCHHGKTPPCTDAILAAGVRRVVAAQPDPFPHVAGGGIERLRQAGLDVAIGVLQDAARELNAPYLKLTTTGRPWVIAKWAMTLDGKIATATGDSQWISNEASRAIVHRLRGRVDAIVVGRKTAERDDPRLTARPPGPRNAIRIVLDSRATLADDSHLVRTARELPVLVVVGPEATSDQRQRLEAAGCEVFATRATGEDRLADRLAQLLAELGRRRLTNVLVEGGGEVLGAAFDANAVDELHVFVAAKVVGGDAAIGPVGGHGVPHIAAAWAVYAPRVQVVQGDVYIHGRRSPTAANSPAD